MRLRTSDDDQLQGYSCEEVSAVSPEEIKQQLDELDRRSERTDQEIQQIKEASESAKEQANEAQRWLERAS